MKKILFSIMMFQLLSCDFSSNNKDQHHGPTPPPPPSPVPSGVTNYMFGYSFPAVSSLKIVPTNEAQSFYFVDAKTESQSDILAITPFVEDLNTIEEQLQANGTPFRKADRNIIVSVNTETTNTAIVFAASPYGGGVAATRITTGEATISESTVNELYNGIRFVEPTISLEQRIQLLQADTQQQRNVNEQQEIQRIRRRGAFLHGLHELNSVGD